MGLLSTIATQAANQSMVQVLAVRAEHQSEERAYTYLADGEHETASVTFGQLYRRVSRIAAELTDARLYGERALLLYPSDMEFICGFLGCPSAGVIPVPCPYPARPRQWPRVLAIAQDCRPAAILTSEAGLEQVRARVLSEEWPAGGRIFATDTGGETGHRYIPLREMPHIAFLQYTSGSTSEPRGVVVTHENIMHNQATIRRAFAQQASDIIASWLPLYHDMGLIGTVLQPLYVGAHCILQSSASFLHRPARWLEMVSRYHATTSGGPNFAWDLCTRRVSEEDLARLDLSSWKVAFSGAEPVNPQTIDAFAHRFAPTGFPKNAFQPCYGLAEATLLVSSGPVGRGPVTARFERSGIEAAQSIPAIPGYVDGIELVGNGHTSNDQQLRIVEPASGVNLEAGMIGEIQLSGPSVAAGYWNNPDATAETFVTVGNRRWLRTGDLGFLSSGELFITGRLKDLIVVRGRNIYPQDLENSASSAHPTLQPGAGAAFAIEREGSEAVVLVHELRRDAKNISENIDMAIRQAIAEQHEVSLADVVLLSFGNLPRTSSGKVRRSFCRAQYLSGAWSGLTSKVRETVTLPSGSLDLLQETIRIVADVLKISPVSIHGGSTLTGLGLDSLRAIDLVQRMEDRWSTEVTAAQLLEGLTLHDLAELAAVPREKPVNPPQFLTSFELTPGQRTLITLDSLAQHASPNNLYAACWMDGPVDSQALFAAATAVVRRHQALHSTLAEFGTDRLVEHPGLGADCALWNLGELDEAGVHKAVEAEGNRPFDLVRGPLLRLRVGLHRGGRHALLIGLHHLAGDLRSLEIILNELGAFYAEGLGQGPAILPQPVPYAEFAASQAQWLKGKAAEAAWEFWRQELAGYTPLEFPYDHPRRGTPGMRGGTVRCELSQRSTIAAVALASGNRTTLYTLLLSVYQVCLHRFTGSVDLTVGSAFLGRNTSRFKDTVGFFANPLPLRVSLRDNPAFSDLLQTNSTCVRRVMRHAELPGSLMAQEFGGPHDGNSPLFQAYFVFEQAGPGHRNLPAVAIGTPGVGLKLGPLQLCSMGVDQNTSQFDLLLYAAEHDGHLQIALNYDSDVFERATAEGLLSGVACLIDSVVDTPNGRIDDLQILNAAQSDKQLRVWNSPARPIAVQDCLHDRFQAQAVRDPHAVAIVDGLNEVSYGELLERSMHLSQALRDLGIGTASRVPLLLRPGINQIVAILAVLQTGAAYVPLDPFHPADRLAYVAQDATGGSAAALLLAERGTEPAAESIRRTMDLSLVLVDACPLGSARAYAPPRVIPNSAAYVIYTSGSTGKPKGVVNTHTNVIRLFTATEAEFHFSAADVWTMFHSYAFDFSVWEIWGALLHGGRLVIVPSKIKRSPRQVYHLIRSEAVTVLCQTPSAFRQLIDTGEPWGSRQGIVLRSIIFGGEALECSTLRSWLQAYEGAPPQLINMYGITETTVHVTYRLLQGEEIFASHRSLIGRPISDLQVYLLDDRFNLLLPGSIGEIFVGGAGLALGYLNRPGLIAERFLPNPFSGLPGDRLYRSGDLGRYRPDGELEYLGRTDHQVKIRGHRIELEEIQHRLSEHPSVRQAFVAASPDRRGETQLVAYICGKIPADTLRSELRAFLETRLPSYMLPAVFVPVERFAVTGNGKIDRAALPLPEAEIKSVRNGMRSLTPTEAALGILWTEILGVGHANPEDSFFVLGGHSMLVLRMVRRVRQIFGIDLPVARVFESPSLSDMAAAIDSLRGIPGLPVIVAVVDRSEFPLSFAQERVWLAEQMRPSTSLFNIPIAIDLKGNLELALLEQSFNRIVDRHEVLRTAFVQTPSGPVQKVLETIKVKIEETSIDSMEKLAFLSESEGARPFELRRPPLFRIRLVRIATSRHVLLLTMHHIVSDLWSAVILLNEVMRTYSALSRGQADPLPALSLQYGDFARWERSEQVQERVSGQAAFWRNELAGADLNYTTILDRPRPEVPSLHGDLVRRSFDEELCSALQDLRMRHGVTLYILLLAAFKVLLLRISEVSDILVGTDVALREIEGVESLIGMFVNQIPLRTHVHPDMTFSEVLNRVRDTTTRAWANRSIPSQHIGRLPLFRILFDLQDLNFSPNADLPLHVERLDSFWATAKHDLSMFVEEQNESLTATLEYNTDVLTFHSADTLLNQYLFLLREIAAQPFRPVGEYALMEAPVQRSLATMFNEALEA